MGPERRRVQGARGHRRQQQGQRPRGRQGEPPDTDLLAGAGVIFKNSLLFLWSRCLNHLIWHLKKTWAEVSDPSKLKVGWMQNGLFYCIKS